MRHTALIANRGEIACRIVRTCRRLGMRAVVVFSDADADARHVRLADEAIRIGPGPAGQSYLAIARVIEAARRVGADLVHPGYGFLAENPAFARAVRDAGLRFAGPSAEAMERLGDKDSAKALAREAGVPVIPGYAGPDQGDGRLTAAARELGFPLLVKAVAGGGGRGMRRVLEAGQFEEALAASRSEAEAAFGRSEVLLERLIDRPRHVEVQVFGDGEGGAVHLFERDCTLQRRHQKIVEEAPAPFLEDGLREALGAAATALVRTARYANAGTVEFLLEPDGRFWFIEMNTRLQVEHPVTEAVTGQDLVAWQLALALGEPLPARQAEIVLRGHAIEARLCAEDPARSFAPSTGPVEGCRLPDGMPGCRVETGVEAGDVVSPFYDSMLAKIIASGPDRATALARLDAALAATAIEGPATNLAYLRRLCRAPDFGAMRIDTTWIDRQPDLARLPEAPGPSDLFAAAAAVLVERERAACAARNASPWERADGWRLNARPRRVVRFAGLEPIEAEGPLSAMRLSSGRTTAAARAGEDGAGVWVELDGHRRRGRAHLAAERLTFELDGHGFALPLGDLPAERDAAVAADGRVTASMPGRVARLLVAVGELVKAGAPLLVLEAMKMEHVLKAPLEGTVLAIGVAPGTQVEEGMLLIEVGPAG